MSGDILYADLYYPSGAGCVPCRECCYRLVEKDAGSAEELTINWKDAADLGHTAQIIDVEAVVLDACNEPVDECTFGFTHLFNSPPKLGRRDYDGPWTVGRIFGGEKGCKYKLYLRATYSKCGHKFHKQICIDVQITNC